MSKYNQYKKNMRAQQTINCFDKLYRNYLKNNIFDKEEYETFFKKYVNEIKKDSSFREYKVKLIFFFKK